MYPQEKAVSSVGGLTKPETTIEAQINDINMILSEIENILEPVLSPTVPTPMNDRIIHNRIHSRLSDVHDHLLSLKNRINL